MVENTSEGMNDKTPINESSTTSATEEPPMISPTMQKATEILQTQFGLTAFRGIQAQIISHLLTSPSPSALAILPTGGGKSLLFQLSALMLEGTAIVVSPLLSLIKDQLAALEKRGINAGGIHSAQTSEETTAVFRDAREGRLKLLYVSPERCTNERFLDLVKNIKIPLLAVDERPSYLGIARFAKEQNIPRVLALTATATPDVAKDICEGFGITPDGQFKTTSFRSNLKIDIKPARDYEHKMSLLKKVLETREGPTIIYTTRQKDVESLAEILRKTGYKDTLQVYHAGMSSEARDSAQDAFMKSINGIIVATIAFGQGIDKPDIRHIVHFSLAKSLESYSQEIGRAGRDGKPSSCLMLIDPQDLPTLQGFTRADTPCLSSVAALFDALCDTPVEEDGFISVSHYHLSRNFDVRDNALGQLFSQMDLDLHLLRMGTPRYNTYKIEAIAGNWAAIEALITPAASALKASWHRTPKYATVDLQTVVVKSKITRSELVSEINKWESAGLAKTVVSNVNNRYKVQERGLPSEKSERVAISKQMFERMLKREEAEVRRLENVLQWASSEDCLAVVLAEYFGDTASVPLGRCENCCFCKTNERLSLSSAKAKEIDEGKVQLVLKACPYRSEARLLARLAFGLTSPALANLKLGGKVPNAAMGCMDDCDFASLEKRFEEECAKADYLPSHLKGEVEPPTKTKRENTISESGTQKKKKPNPRSKKRID